MICLRPFIVAVLAALVAALAVPASAPAASAQAASAPSVRGHITATEVTTNASYGMTKRAVVRWDIAGPRRASGSTWIVAARPTIVEHAERRSYINESDERICADKTLVGWRGGVQPTVDVVVSTPHKNLITRTARSYVSLVDSPAAVAIIRHSDCGTDWQWGPFDGEGPLVDPLGVTGPNTSAIIGQGALDNDTPNDYLAPTWTTLRLSNGVWLSTGTLTRSGKGYGDDVKTVTVSWSISTADPSSQCALPARKLVRGKTVAQVSALLRRSGHRPVVSRSSMVRGVAVNRVASILNLGGPRGAQTCGKRVTMVVRSR
ncbi:MAG: hypothetical protein QOE19_2941 [Actinomycetota bacterium]|jgi:hypothetical protein|nr:hypothetical protein [Actinomycetota bacterium]